MDRKLLEIEQFPNHPNPINRDKNGKPKPVIVATLGLSDVDEEGPWIPEPEELDALRESLQAYFPDHEIFVYHHGLKIQEYK